MLIAHGPKNSNPKRSLGFVVEKRGLAAYKFWDDILNIRDEIIKNKSNKEILIDNEVFKVLSRYFLGLSIKVDFFNDLKYEGFSDVDYDNEKNELSSPTILLHISKEVSPSKIERTLCHEINHLYEIYQRFQNKDEIEEKIKNLSKVDGDIDYQALIQLKNPENSDDLNYAIDILYMLGDPSERNAFSAESAIDGRWFKSKDEKNSEIEILRTYKDFEFFLNTRGDDVSCLDLGKIMKCFKKIPDKYKLEEQFKKYFKKKSLFFIDKARKQVQRVYELGLEMKENVEFYYQQKKKYEDSGYHGLL